MFVKEVVSDSPLTDKQKSISEKIKAQRSLFSYRKMFSNHKIWNWLLCFFNILCIAIIVVMGVIGNADRIKYTINADQNNKVKELQYTSKFAIKALQKYKNKPIINTPINEVIQYLVDFKYMPNTSWSESINIANFNDAVNEYRQWPQSNNPVNHSQTKDRYSESISTLSRVIVENTNNISELDRVDIQNFLYWLDKIDMTVYSDINSYTNALLMGFLYPSLIFLFAFAVSLIYFYVIRLHEIRRMAIEWYENQQSS